MEINWFEKKISNRPRIEMLISCMGWDVGDRFIIQMEDGEGLYFDDV